MTKDPDAVHNDSRRLIAQPAVWATGLFAMAVLITLTAPASRDPTSRVAIALLIGGTVLLVMAATERRVTVSGVGLLSILAGGLLLSGGEDFRQPVTWGFGVAALVAGARVSRQVRSRGGAWPEVLLVMSASALTAGLLAVFSRELLPLGLGLVGVFLVGLAVLGIGRLAGAEEDQRLTSTMMFTAAFRDIRRRAAGNDETQPIHDKLLFEGTERRPRFGRFLLLMGFASVIASLGIATDSTAVVIGGMLVAPLLTPLMGMSLSMVMGWTGKLTRAAAVAGSGVLVAVGSGFLIAAMVGQGIDL